MKRALAICLLISLVLAGCKTQEKKEEGSSSSAAGKSISIPEKSDQAAVAASPTPFAPETSSAASSPVADNSATAAGTGPDRSTAPTAETPPSSTVPASTAPAIPLLSKPQPAYFVEMPSDALPVWRRYRNERPTLVIFSSDPMLMAIPPQVSERITALVEQGKSAEFPNYGRVQLADPLLLPEHTLSAALHAGFFGRVVWILPPQETGKEIPPDTFRRQLVQNGILTEAETSALTHTNGRYQGTLQGLPFMAVVAGPLPPLDGPVILHFDLNFFTAQYRNEITTPLFTLLHGTLVALRQTGWPTMAAVFSIGTEEGAFPLEFRFVKNLLADIFADPTLLDSGLPEAWALRKDALYQETFFQPEAMLNNYLHMEEIRPKDASAKFDIYRALVMLKDRESALGYLDEAIKLDKGYAREYINLATTASSKGRDSDALAYLTKAEKLLPKNPFVRMEAANVMLRLGMKREAAATVRELQQFPWSTVYYPNIHSALKELAERVAKADDTRAPRSGSFLTPHN